MLIETLALLRCPFCGGRLSTVENAVLDRGTDRIEHGVLGCECCAFPVVAGIPVLMADDAARDAMRALEAGRRGDALHALLGLDDARRDAFRKLTAPTGRPTYRDLLGVLCADAEADYLLHRFSDPTFLLAESLLDALGRARRRGTPPESSSAPAAPTNRTAGRARWRGPAPESSSAPAVPTHRTAGRAGRRRPTPESSTLPTTPTYRTAGRAGRRRPTPESESPAEPRSSDSAGAPASTGSESPADPRSSDSAGTPVSADPAAGRALDLCGGSGHLTRVLLRQPACAGAVVADVHFWKLWLAARFVAPACEPVRCDADAPLPFADGRFATVLLSDAFPYVWHKRLLAGEMQRVATRGGVIVMPHLHSAHGENHSAGNTLSPAAYRDLFAPFAPRLFDDLALLAALLDEGLVDLAHHTPPAECGDTPSVTLVATRDGRLYRRHAARVRRGVTGVLAVNPLYRVDYADGVSRLTLAFPGPEYEEEFGLARRYLPASLAVEGDLRGAVAPAAAGRRLAELRRRRVLLDLPRGYC